ncbi:MAG: sporulation protein [Oscillospiraceae bacterium]|nr:sporulation protein [Oscillospiraceae bacterium]
MDKYTQGLRTRMAELFDLPADLVAGLAHMELLGSRQFFLEGHEGILAYSDTQIDISTGGAVVRVRGSALELRSMTDREVRIRGSIDAVEFVR